MKFGFFRLALSNSQLKFQNVFFRRYVYPYGLALTLGFGVMSAKAETPSLEALWERVQRQEEKIEALKEQLLESKRGQEASKQRLQGDNKRQASKIAKVEMAIDETISAIEGGALSLSQVQTTIGGYGELHYNQTDYLTQMDLHRFVLFFSHQFNDEISFYSEFEVEHGIAGEGKVGEVEIEQAFVQWDYHAEHRARAGVFLLPIGFLNETHEPDTFYGVERNPVEKNIIPATWWEGGLSLDGEIAPAWYYALAVHSGLNLDTDNAKASKRSSIRSGRQKVGKAAADQLAYTASLQFSGIPGIQWRSSIQYQSDLGQDDVDNIGLNEVDAWLFESSLSYRRGGFGLRALYAQWDIDTEIEVLNAGASKQLGWYLEPSYRWGALGVFARLSSYNLTEASSLNSNERQQVDVGLNYWLHERVVIKADYQIQNNEFGLEDNGFNLGLGYSF